MKGVWRARVLMTWKSLSGYMGVVSAMGDFLGVAVWKLELKYAAENMLGMEEGKASSWVYLTVLSRVLCVCAQV